MGVTGCDIDFVRAAQQRLAACFTQADAADRLDINRVTLNKIENGKARVSLGLVERMATLYGCSREVLLGEPEEVDEIEQGRARIAEALDKIGSGFEELTAVLNAQLGEFSTRSLVER